ncbi:hypothetical protein F66182_619 [Fusarium sp. NRRL 66182]|nr:hypothetical protein F66182_619 [Fusarium sp. NRRL 66182]
MASIFPTRIVFASGKDKSIPWTRRAVISDSSTYLAPAASDQVDDDEDGILTATRMVTETMNPYTETSRDRTATTLVSSSAQVPATPDATSISGINYESTIPTSSRVPEFLSSRLHGSHGLSDGGIAAVVIGVVFGLLLIVSTIWFLAYRRRRSWSNDRYSTPPQTPRHISSLPRILPVPGPNAHCERASTLPELNSFTEQVSTLPESWVSYGDPRETLSPTPQPAVAEVRSFTRAWQKPRVYTVGGRIAELPGSEVVPEHEDDISPISPVSAGHSSHARRHTSPPPLMSRFSSSAMSSSAGSDRGESQSRGNGEVEENQSRGYNDRGEDRWRGY